MKDLLIELFSEEIPSGMQALGSMNFKKLMTEGLVDAGLTYENAAVFFTPTRLVLIVSGLIDMSSSEILERRGPRTDAPENAVLGFLRSTGLKRNDLEVQKVKNGEFFFAKIKKPGRPSGAIVSETLKKTIEGFPWPKSMRWGAGTMKWARPLKNIMGILYDETGANVIDLTIDGLVANNKSVGHRFLAGQSFSVNSFDDLKLKLKKSFVILDQAERRAEIKNSATNGAFALGFDVVEDELLLNEVTGLVEWPTVLIGQIDKEFLELPAEVLQVSMRQHQKFFSLKRKKTNRIEGFITVANIKTKDQGATILRGNQKVLSARLSDAKFFLENDLRVVNSGMLSWIEKLKNVTFHKKLGNQNERVERLRVKSIELSDIVGANKKLVEQAALFAKADLASEMVYEFPELQGVMGSHYAKFCDFPVEVALAIREHYSPLGPTDKCPTEPVSVTVSLADKLDVLISFWKAGERPTGSKDPFALRRAALGVIRLLVENNISLDLVSQMSSLENEKALDLMNFIYDRFRVFLRDDDVTHDIVDACLAANSNNDIFISYLKAKALSKVLNSESGRDLVQGFKRSNNILTKAESDDGVSYELDPDTKFFEVKEEHELWNDLNNLSDEVAKAVAQNNFSVAVEYLAELRKPIDNFFSMVKVNSENSIVRRNRLCLLHRIKTTITKIADLSLIEG